MSGRESGLINLNTGKMIYRVDCHNNVTAFTFHPIVEYIAVGSDDSSWSLHDIKNG